jgi:micrococcal nuclease
LLAYVWLSNGIFVNERMVSDGYALAMTISPNVRYTDLLFAAQQKARQHRVGLWKENAFAETPRHWRKLHPNPL